MAQLPNLKDRLVQLQRAADRLPRTAAAATAEGYRETSAARLSPAGVPLAARKEGGVYDPERHVLDSYRPFVEGNTVGLRSAHRAAGILRHGRKGEVGRDKRGRFTAAGNMKARPVVPGESGKAARLDLWLRILSQHVGQLLEGGR